MALIHNMYVIMLQIDEYLSKIKLLSGVLFIDYNTIVIGDVESEN